MSTGIEWTDETWNPVTGCTKVSQGCKNCYAERLAPKVFAGQTATMGGVTRPRAFTDVVTHHERLDAPLHWRKPRRIFVNSMSDLFHEDVPFEFIASVFAIMSVTTRHSYQILTKRPQRMLEFFKWESLRQDSDGEWFELRPDDFEHGDRIHDHWPADIPWIPHNQKGGGYDNCGPGWPYANVWLGVSVEDQATADERIPLLLKTPAAIRFLSCEPLLGSIDLTVVRRGPSTDDLSLDGRDRIKEYFVDAVTGTNGVLMHAGSVLLEPFSRNKIDWVIAGGESGPGARPSHPDWFRSLRDQCAAAAVPYFFKQWGEWWPIAQMPNGCLDEENNNPKPRDSCVIQLDGRVEFDFPKGAMSCYKVGKKAAGRMLDGRQHMEWPA